MLQEKLSLYFYLLYGGHNRGHVSRAHAMMGDSPTTARKKKKKSRGPWKHSLLAH